MSAIMFLPQVLHTWQTKSAKDLSVGTLAVSASSMVLWLIYGAHIHDLPILFGNSVNLLFTLVLVFFKLRFGARTTSIAAG
jgi:MtN3 and saliva related transmembrane protein